ncbi:DoxX family protein [bacterium]|nr:DoxX family protein [bacterium]
MKISFAFGRLALGMIFLVSGLDKALHYNSTLQLMTAQGIPAAALLLPVATVVELLGSTLLIFGYQIKAVSLLLSAYLIPVTWAFHRFWMFSGDARQLQLINLLKNFSIFGGLVLTHAYQRVLDSFTAGTLTTIRRDSYERRKAA